MARRLFAVLAALAVLLANARAEAQSNGYFPVRSFNPSTGLSGDLSCTSGGVCTVVSISGASPVNVVNGALSFGTNPASTGSVRLPNAGTVYARNSGNTADVELVSLNSNSPVFSTSSQQSFVYGSPLYLYGSSGNGTIYGYTSVFDIVNASGMTTSFANTGLTLGATNAWGISQSAPGSDVATYNLTFTSEAPYASATVHMSPGDIVANTPAPISTGAPGALDVQSGGTNYAQLGQLSNGSAYGALWLANVARSSSNDVLSSDGTSLNVNAPNSGGTISFTFGGGADASMTSSAFTLSFNTLQWSSGISGANLTQASESSATQGANLTITPQQSTQATNFGGGSIVHALQTPGGTGAEAFDEWTRGGSAIGYVGPLVGTAGYLAVYSGSTAPSSSNYILANNGTSTFVNGPGSNTLVFQVGATTYAKMSSAGFLFGTAIGGFSTQNEPLTFAPCSIALTSGTANSLTNSQYVCPSLKFTGSITGTGTTVVYPATDGAFWVNDFSAVTGLSASNTIGLVANSQTYGTAVTNTLTTQFPYVRYSAGVGRLVGVSMQEWAIPASLVDDVLSAEPGNDNAAHDVDAASGF